MGTEVKHKYDDCLKQKRIKPFSDGPRLAQKELQIAEKDMKTAEHGLKIKQWKWSTIQAYYSMFHAARALLFSKGFNERSHYCLRIALEYHYASHPQFPTELIDIFQTARLMRENADYEESFSEMGARKLVKAAEQFITAAKEILE